MVTKRPATASSPSCEHDAFDLLKTRAEACRICRDAPRGPRLPHEPRPILQGTSAARILVASQAPGIRAHRSGRPFQDPSGVRLRSWLGLGEADFYDPRLVAIVPMGLCFPGHDEAGGDRPPRRECMPAWRVKLLAALPRIELVLPIGIHAQGFHLGPGPGLGARMERWHEVFASSDRPRILPLPHPSWRNSGWLKRNPWFETELLPVLRAEVAARLRSTADHGSDGAPDRPPPIARAAGGR